MMKGEEQGIIRREKGEGQPPDPPREVWPVKDPGGGGGGYRPHKRKALERGVGHSVRGVCHQG